MRLCDWSTHWCSVKHVVVVPSGKFLMLTDGAKQNTLTLSRQTWQMCCTTCWTFAFLYERASQHVLTVTSIKRRKQSGRTDHQIQPRNPANKTLGRFLLELLDSELAEQFISVLLRAHFTPSAQTNHVFRGKYLIYDLLKWIDYYSCVLLLKAGMQRGKNCNVKHSSFPEQIVNLYKGSERPGVLYQLSAQPDVRE